jgi:hypothetical protein
LHVYITQNRCYITFGIILSLIPIVIYSFLHLLSPVSLYKDYHFRMTSANTQDYPNTPLTIKQTSRNLDSSPSTLKVSIQYAKWFPASTGSAVSFSPHLTPSQNFTSFFYFQLYCTLIQSQPKEAKKRSSHDKHCRKCFRRVPKPIQTTFMTMNALAAFSMIVKVALLYKASCRSTWLD